MENRNLLNNRKQLLAVVCLVLFAVISRLLPHPPNFAPVTAVALFAGANVSGAKKFLIPLTIMVVSDLFLGFHGTMLYVYGCFFFITILGSVLRIQNSFGILVATSFVSSLLFYLVTNFGVWFHSGMYSKTLEGLTQSYIMGIPFLQNTFFGDTVYTITIFYGYRFIESIVYSRIHAKY